LKPRKEEASKEALELLRKANQLDERIEEIQKAEPGYSVAFETTPHEISIESESGGRTRNAHYTTNNHLLSAEDMKNKGASKSTTDLDSLSRKLNTHDQNTGHEDFVGGDGPKLE
jgi:hypothetical protein